MQNLRFMILVCDGEVVLGDEVLEWLSEKGWPKWPLLVGENVLEFDSELKEWKIAENVMLKEFERKDGITIRKKSDLDGERMILVVDGLKVKVYLREVEPIGAWMLRWLEENYLVEIFDWDEVFDLKNEVWQEILVVDGVYGVMNVRWWFGAMVREKIVKKKIWKEFSIRGWRFLH